MAVLELCVRDGFGDWWRAIYNSRPPVDDGFPCMISSFDTDTGDFYVRFPGHVPPTGYRVPLYYLEFKSRNPAVNSEQIDSINWK